MPRYTDTKQSYKISSGSGFPRICHYRNHTNEKKIPVRNLFAFLIAKRRASSKSNLQILFSVLIVFFNCFCFVIIVIIKQIGIKKLCPICVCANNFQQALSHYVDVTLMTHWWITAGETKILTRFSTRTRAYWFFCIGVLEVAGVGCDIRI